MPDTVAGARALRIESQLRLGIMRCNVIDVFSMIKR